MFKIPIIVEIPEQMYDFYRKLQKITNYSLSQDFFAACVITLFDIFKTLLVQTMLIQNT